MGIVGNEFEYSSWGSSLVTQMVKNLPANAGDLGLIPGSGRSPGRGNGYPLQCSCLKNPMDRGAWQATVHRVWTRLMRLSTHSPQNLERFSCRLREVARAHRFVCRHCSDDSCSKTCCLKCSFSYWSSTLLFSKHLTLWPVKYILSQNIFIPLAFEYFSFRLAPLFVSPCHTWIKI